MSNGWIKLNRSIQDHWLWKEKPFDKKSAWIDLLLMANHKDNKFMLGNEIVYVKQGSFITSEVKLMNRWGWSKTKVRNFLNVLEAENMISREADRKKTTINIVNYTVYQGCEDHEKTTKEPIKDTNKNEKNVKNNNISKDIYVDVINSWNDLGLSSIKTISNNREKLLKARIKEHGVNEVIKAIESIKNSDFLKGQNNKGWTITFDWLIKPNNFVKVLEGNYINKGNKNKIVNFDDFIGV